MVSIINNLLPIFPMAKMTGLVAIYFLFGNDDLLVYSLGAIGVSFFVRLFNGNPFVLVRKYIRQENILLVFLIVNYAVGLVTCIVWLFLSNRLADHYSTAMLIAATKFLESTVLVFIIFNRYNNNLCNLGNVNLKVHLWLATSIVIETTVFLVSDVYLGFSFALKSSLIFCLSMSSVLVYLLRDEISDLVGLETIQSSFNLLKDNLEIALTVLPVSLYFLLSPLYFDQNDEVVVFVVGFLGLSYSMAGFVSRPISYIATLASDRKSLHLLYFFALISFAFCFLYSSYYFESGAHSFVYVYSLVSAISISCQNYIRVESLAYHNGSLSLYHVFETAIIAGCMAVFGPIVSFQILLVTRFIRLGVLAYAK